MLRDKPRPQERPQERSQERLEAFPGIRMRFQTLSLTSLAALLAAPNLGSAPRAETLEPLIPSVSRYRAHSEQIKVS